MHRYSLWHYVLLVVLTLIGVIYALPNVYGEDPAIQISAKNGTFFDVAIEKKIAYQLNTQNILYLSMQSAKNTFLIRFNNIEDQIKAQEIVKKITSNNYSIALNLASRTPRWLQMIGAKPMHLGLDLRGGIHFLLNVDIDDTIKAQEISDFQKMVTVIHKVHIRYRSMKMLNALSGMTIFFHTQEESDQALTLLKKQFSDYRFEKRTGGIQSTFSKIALHQIQQNAIDQIMMVLRNRVNALGVEEPVIQQQGINQISIDLPGIQDAARAKDIIGKVATIRLQLLDVEHDAGIALKTGDVPLGSKLYIYEEKPILLKQQVVLRGTSIIDASSVVSDDGRPAVYVRVHGSDVPFFNRITRKSIGKPLAVVYVETETFHHLDINKMVTQHRQIEKIINIATIQTALGNNFQITNLSTMDYANNLALLLRSGAYSVPVDFVQEHIVGPSLGQENIRTGILSTEIGTFLVILFMAFYYRLFGIIANTALILNIVFIIAILSMLGATLTLPSIAGIVLTVGMSVDANVLINERIREELYNGMLPQESIATGYKRAFTTIVDANMTTLIVMITLLALCPGPVQGFAVTTTIGLLSSMLTAVFFTRALINLIYKRPNTSHLSIGIRMKPIETKNNGIF